MSQPIQPPEDSVYKIIEDVIAPYADMKGPYLNRQTGKMGLEWHDVYEICEKVAVRVALQVLIDLGLAPATRPVS